MEAVRVAAKAVEKGVVTVEATGEVVTVAAEREVGVTAVVDLGAEATAAEATAVEVKAVEKAVEKVEEAREGADTPRRLHRFSSVQCSSGWEDP